MEFSENWLRTFINPDITSNKLSYLLTMSGLEVETVEEVAPHFSNVVIGKILAIAKHANANHLNVCQVDVNKDSTINIITSNTINIQVGMKVPCAIAGAILPSVNTSRSFTVKISKFYEIESQGILCSEKDLQLSQYNNLIELPNDAPIGKKFCDYFLLHDFKFTIKLTPNRADCLSLLGIAREVSALTAIPFKKPCYKKIQANSNEKFPVKISVSNLCGRFVGRVIRGLNAKAKTPLWMKLRLEHSGQRSTSAIADISKYVMLEFGCPSQIFNLDTIYKTLTIRWGKNGEKFKLFNGNIIEINEWVGVIADKKQIQSLAGIVNSDISAVVLSTTNIYLAVAFWFPEAIQGRARYYKISTDASHRFERGIDFSLMTEYIERITSLLIEICSNSETKIGEIDDIVIRLPKREPIIVRTSKVIKIIGITITDEIIADIFTRLNLKFIRKLGLFIVTPPSYRFDIKIEENLIAEIARIYGFEKIQAISPLTTSIIRVLPENTRSLFTIRHLLANLDYQEVINFSFVDNTWEIDFTKNYNPIKLFNPIAHKMSVMRSSLIASLIANVQYNINRKINRVRIFEISTVFIRDKKIIDSPLEVANYYQPKYIAGLAYGKVVKEQWGQLSRNVDFFDVKADVEVLFSPRILRFVSINYPALHPGRSAHIVLSGEIIGIIGELHPHLQQKYNLPLAPIVFELKAQKLQERNIPNFVEISKFPSVTRDLALVIKKSVQAQELFDVFTIEKKNNAVCSIIQTIVLFDEYHGKGLQDNEKSLAFRFTLQNMYNTLRDQSINTAMDAMLSAVVNKFSAKLRY